mmetsp:Transcript_12601/g.38932  ORF Transcript_12601/g.38932 Transcript_12601/m.38932 type:complete len:324 (+) Transcript_12601:828-1799(+)
MGAHERRSHPLRVLARAALRRRHGDKHARLQGRVLAVYVVGDGRRPGLGVCDRLRGVFEHALRPPPLALFDDGRGPRVHGPRRDRRFTEFRGRLDRTHGPDHGRIVVQRRRLDGPLQAVFRHLPRQAHRQPPEVFGPAVLGRAFNRHPLRRRDRLLVKLSYAALLARARHHSTRRHYLLRLHLLHPRGARGFVGRARDGVGGSGGRVARLAFGGGARGVGKRLGVLGARGQHADLRVGGRHHAARRVRQQIHQAARLFLRVHTLPHRGARPFSDDRGLVPHPLQHRLRLLQGRRGVHVVRRPPGRGWLSISDERARRAAQRRQ